jgi:membrane-bound lytic murein transglycosylase A
MKRIVFLFLALLVLAVSGCGPEATRPLPVDVEPTYVPVAENEAETLAAHLSPGLLGAESWSGLRPVLEQNLSYIRNRPQDAVCVNRPGLVLTWGMLGDSVAELLAVLDDLDRDPRLLAERFQWLKLAPGTLLTGYYEPWLKASLTPDDTYRYPLYGVPDDLKTLDLGAFHPRWKGQTLTYRVGEEGVEPYYDREAIDGKGALVDRGLEIAWAADPVDVFFLQIQGSGRLDLPDGTAKHILYGGKNGRQYRSLGKLLIERGHIPREEMSMQRIRTFLNDNPDVAVGLLFENPSYVFFRLADDGPYGSMASILTPRVSVAVDRRVIPLGSVVALKTALIDYGTGESELFLSLMAAQDTGGAIQGTRMDLFCGTGPEAEQLAGHLQEDSEVFMLISKKVLDATPDNAE